MSLLAAIGEAVVGILVVLLVIAVGFKEDIEALIEKYTEYSVDLESGEVEEVNPNLNSFEIYHTDGTVTTFSAENTLEEIKQAFEEQRYVTIDDSVLDGDKVKAIKRAE